MMKPRIPKDLYEHPVRGVSPDALGEHMRRSLEAVAALWPERTGITLFVTDFGEKGGLAYISNATRDSMIETVKEFIARQEKLR